MASEKHARDKGHFCGVRFSSQFWLCGEFTKAEESQLLGNCQFCAKLIIRQHYKNWKKTIWLQKNWYSDDTRCTHLYVWSCQMCNFLYVCVGRKYILVENATNCA